MPEIIELTDLDEREELQLYTSLNEAQLLHYYEPNGGIFIAESPKVIERALDAGCPGLCGKAGDSCAGDRISAHEGNVMCDEKTGSFACGGSL